VTFCSKFATIGNSIFFRQKAKKSHEFQQKTLALLLHNTVLEYLEGSFGTLRLTDFINFCKNCPKTFSSLRRQKQILRGLVLILPCSRSKLDLKVAAANSTFCKWRCHEFSTRFGDHYIFDFTTFELMYSFLTEDSHGTIVCLLLPLFLPPNFDWVFLTVVIKVMEVCNT